jgi:hypothetical protein
MTYIYHWTMEALCLVRLPDVLDTQTELDSSIHLTPYELDVDG